MRVVEPYIYRRGAIWWAYDSGRRWSLRTTNRPAAWAKFVEGVPDQKRRQTVGSVYFIRFGNDGPIKIGRAVNVPKRIGCMQTGAPEKLHLLATMPGGAPQERAVLRRFAHLRLRGEWFRAESDLFAFIASLTQAVAA